MRAFWFDPYLWVHAAGVAVLPLWLLLCMLGFAVGDPIFPAWLELGLVALAGITPIAWMQSQKPFYIFSLLAVAIRPERLTDDQRRLLTLFWARRNPVWIGLGAFLLFLLLQKIYRLAPIAASVTPLSPGLRGLGLILAAIAFLASNLFLQVPLSVLRVMLTSDQEFSGTEPFALEQIPQNFLIFGLPVNQILPPVEAVVARSSQSNPASVAVSSQAEPSTKPPNAEDELKSP